MKRGRVSTAELSVVPLIQLTTSRLSPPRDLSASEARLFRELVSSVPPDHFLKSDLLLVGSYVQAASLSRQLGKRVAKEPQLAGAWERVTRTQALLATRLRLTPRGRIDRTMMGRKAANYQPGIEDAISASGVDLDD